MLLSIYCMDCWFLALLFMYVAVDIIVCIIFHVMDSSALLVVIYRDFLCYLVYRPQGCNKLELS